MDIKKISVVVSLTLLGTLTLHGEGSAITLKTLLADMTNRDRLASWPKVEYRCATFSSYDRSSTASDKPGWFANTDFHQFIRIETNSGRQECVLLDADGPGAMVHIWNAADCSGKLRFYLDGNDTPAIEAPVLDLIGGRFLADKPFSYILPEIPLYGEKSWLARNVWFPVPYAKHCKITWDGNPTGMFYYTGQYLTFAPDASVEPFAMEQLKSYSNDIAVAGKMLDQRAKPARGNVAKTDAKIDAGTAKIIFAKSDGAGAVRTLKISIRAEDYQQALRSTILEINFDGERCVWSPVGDFFGTGYDIYPHSTWYTWINQQGGSMECMWTMPFSKSVEIRLNNLGQQEVKATAEIGCGSWTWDDRSMYFHATWHQITKHSGKHSDQNYVTIKGKGVYVGDSLCLFNNYCDWWGEGDEKITVDGETFPSHFGTGTEDYYGYSWCRPNFFEMPWHAQPVGRGNKTAGITLNNRYRLLDAIPFKSSLKFDMEICLPFVRQGQGVNFAPATFFYAFPGSVTVSPTPDPEAAKRPVVFTPVQFKAQKE